MIKSADMYSDSNPIFLELTSYYSEQMNSHSIWQLAEKGFLYKAFKNSNSVEFFLNSFHHKVTEVIDLRRSKLLEPRGKLVLSGRFLLFYPTVTMYDGLSEKESSGLFDADDVPPPEFWIGVEDGKLVSFIPTEFMDKAIAGVEICLSGCLEWI
jgi:hypothetical protein